MERAFLTTRGELAGRLLAALEAGQAAGGDKRGQQSAALLVVRPSKDYPEYATRYVDLRVEDHREPIRELVRVFGILEATKLSEAHLRFAEEYEKAGRKDLAQIERERVGEALKRALARGENDASNLNGLAWTCATNGVFLPEALTAAERAAGLEPKNTGILDTLAEVQFRMGNAAKAAEVEARALDLEPNDSYLKAQLARFRAGAK
jgi:tetratricopeptide (TPR) repeat protein